MLSTLLTLTREDVIGFGEQWPKNHLDCLFVKRSKRKCLKNMVIYYTNSIKT